MQKHALGQPLTKKFPSASSFTLFISFPVVCYWITKRWEVEMQLPRLSRRTSVALSVFVVNVVVYFFVLPRLWYRKGVTTLDRVIIRVVLHPILFEIANLTLRVYVRNTDFGPRGNTSMSPLFVTPVLVLSSQYGRFLIAAASRYYETIILALVVGAIECSLRLSSGKRDWILYRIFKGREAADAILNDPPKRAFRARLVALDAIVECNSIITGSVVQYVFQYASTEGEGVSFGRLLANIFGQLAIEAVVSTTIAILEEREAKVPVRKEWYERGGGNTRVYFWGHGLMCVNLFFYFVTSLTAPGGSYETARVAYYKSL